MGKNHLKKYEEFVNESRTSGKVYATVYDYINSDDLLEICGKENLEKVFGDKFDEYFNEGFDLDIKAEFSGYGETEEGWFDENTGNAEPPSFEVYDEELVEFYIEDKWFMDILDEYENTKIVDLIMKCIQDLIEEDLPSKIDYWEY